MFKTGPNGTTLGYDPGMRLYETASGGTTQRFAYDGLDRIAEYDGSNVLQRCTVHGPNMDEPLVQYEGAGTTDRRFLSSDERGSIISVTDSAGALLGINRYDEFGNPQSTNIGTWGYTGQPWLPSVGVWYYKARDYDPELGRFLQTDPIDISGGINLYAYVENDPINWTDPLGLRMVCVTGPGVDPETGEVVRGSQVTTCGDLPGSPGSGYLPGLGYGGQGVSPSDPRLRVRVALAPEPRMLEPRLTQSNCPVTNTTLGAIAREAGEIADATAGIAIVTGVLGLATSETIVGGVAFGGISIGASAVSLVASGVQIFAETVDRNTRTAQNHALGTAVGAGTSLSLSAVAGRLGGPAVRLGASVAGEIYGRSVTSVACGG